MPYMGNDLKELGKKLDTLMDNHFVHLNIKITHLENDMKWVKGIGFFLIVNSIAVLVKVFI
mgnify:CR=1 FL=1